jgi:hypothetical protein
MKHNTIFSLATLVALSALDVVQCALPRVDFDRMGKVGLFGDFAGLDWFNETLSLSLDPSSSSLLSRSSDGSLSRVGSTNSGGSIYDGCALKDVFYVAGQFSSFGSTTAQNIASYTPSSGKISALGSGGPNGAIRSVYCDANNNRVWVGGEFSSPSSLVAVWNPSSPPGLLLRLAGCQRTTTAGYSRYPQTRPSPVYCLLDLSSRVSKEVLSMAQITPTSRSLPVLLRSLRHSFLFPSRTSRSIPPLPRLTPTSGIFATSSVPLEMTVPGNRGLPRMAPRPLSLSEPSAPSVRPAFVWATPSLMVAGQRRSREFD